MKKFSWNNGMLRFAQIKNYAIKIYGGYNIIHSFVTNWGDYVIEHNMFTGNHKLFLSFPSGFYRSFYIKTIYQIFPKPDTYTTNNELCLKNSDFMPFNLNTVIKNTEVITFNPVKVWLYFLKLVRDCIYTIIAADIVYESSLITM